MPPLVMVTLCEAEVVPALMVAKAMVEAESVACGIGPVPVSAIVCVGLDALLTIVMVALYPVVVAGLKVILSVQKELAARTVPLLQVETVGKSVESVYVMPLIVTEAEPVLVMETVCTALVDPTAVTGKVSEVDERVSVPVPGEPVPALPPPPHPVRREKTETNATAKEQLRSME